MNRTWLSLSVLACVALLGVHGTGQSLASVQPASQPSNQPANQPSNPASATGKPPIFDARPYNESRTAAEAAGKWFIVKATAVWCAPCKQMDRTTWRDDKVVSWLKDHAVAVAIDVDELPDLAAELSIRAMPTVIAFKDGKEFDRVVGMKKPDAFIEWLDGMARGEKSVEAARRPAGGGPGGQADDKAPGNEQDVQTRLNRARALMNSGNTQEAAAEFEWLWTNMLKHQPSMHGVRISFMAGDMKRLAASDAPARARFVALRDAAGVAMQEPKITHDQAIDWVTLNGVVGEDFATLEWFDRVKDQPRWRPILGYVEYPVSGLLIERERWADLGLIFADPVETLNREHLIHGEVRQAQHGDAVPVEMRRRLQQQQDVRFRTRIGQVYAGLLAAERENDAGKFAVRAREIDPSPEMTDSLVTWALRVKKARPAFAEWLAGRTDPAGKQLAEQVDAALRSDAK